jgi:choline-glycine betaine transporter
MTMKGIKILSRFEVFVFSALAALMVALGGLLFSIGFHGQAFA